jgi:hypothetical protein
MLRTHVFEVEMNGSIRNQTQIEVPLSETVRVIQQSFAEKTKQEWTDHWVLYLRGRPLHESTPLNRLYLTPDSFFIARESIEPIRVSTFVSPDDLYPLKPLPPAISQPS